MISALNFENASSKDNSISSPRTLHLKIDTLALHFLKSHDHLTVTNKTEATKAQTFHTALSSVLAFFTFFCFSELPEFKSSVLIWSEF